MLKNPDLQKQLQKILPIDIDISKENPCTYVQLVASFGIDPVKIFTLIIGPELQKIGITIDPSQYSFIIKCICPDLDMNKPLNCSKINEIVNALLNLPGVKDEIGIDITSSNKCDVLQKLIDSDIKFVDIIYGEIIKILPPAVTPPRRKIIEAINCLCPNLKPYKPPVTPDEPTNDKLKYNKFIIIISCIISVLFVFISYGLLSLLFKPSSNIKLFMIILILTTITLSLLIFYNVKCIFKPCVKSGETWVPVQGRYQGKKSVLGVSITADIFVNKNNTITLNNLSCDGKNCIFENLIENCSDPVVNINLSRTNFGYQITGSCVDKIYNIKSAGKQVVKGVWIGKNNDTLFLNVKINVPLVGDMFINIDLEQH
jgi:hypothetical protein